MDGHIDIDLDVEKLEGKSGTATYAEIKAYIKEKYGFKVTNLYIGQIKDKAGIKNRKNYNTGSAKGRVPACPPEKEEAIMDTFLRYSVIEREEKTIYEYLMETFGIKKWEKIQFLVDRETYDMLF